MADYRTMFDYKHLRAWDLGPIGTEVTVTIERVEPGLLETKEGPKRVPFIYFKGYAKALGYNKTNGRATAGMYGKDPTKWVGKRVTLYVTETEMDGAMVECIRIRPQVPADETDPADLLARRPDEPKKGRAA